jgi:outer membrane protein OmpA-like peptidoglycan-associated protein
VIGARRVFALGALGAAVSLAGALAVGACTTSSHVASKKDELTKFLLRIDEPARICAPRQLAEARANLEFAAYEADEGQSIRAYEHLKMAEIRSREAWQGSRGSECEGDRDLDGIRDSKDSCPTEPEDYDGDRDEDGCPDFDRDGDGIDDETDKCPDDPEDKDGFEDEDGCPDPDNDQDGIKDTIDQCPLQPEDKDGWEDIDGCPDPDNDKDGIPDSLDKCPNEPEDMDGVEDEDGCPDADVKVEPPKPVSKYKHIVITDKRIELKQKIFFKYRKATIQAKSFSLLNEVADVLIKRPTMTVRIEGHTDSKGQARHNKKLSDKRAQSVRQFLMEAGVEPSRLKAIGLGEEQPIASNKKEAGREKNRRVEFHITHQ